jgi:hypothetical protein
MMSRRVHKAIVVTILVVAGALIAANLYFISVIRHISLITSCRKRGIFIRSLRMAEQYFSPVPRIILSKLHGANHCLLS